MLKAVLAGVGGISSAHIPGWRALEDVRFAAICDIRPEQMEKYSDIRHYTDVEEMLETEKPDILDICLPTFLHADYAVKAMEKGIHVLCEKPAALSSEDVRRIYAAAEKNHVLFMPAQDIRFWREYEIAKNFYETKTYGNLLSGSMYRLSTYPDWSWDGWMKDEKRSGLVPCDLHIHDLDFLMYAFGNPKEYIPFRSKKKDQDFLDVVYRFDGFFVETKATWYAASYPFSAGFRFQFENAVVVNDAAGFKVYLRDGEVLDLNEEVTTDTGELDLPKTDAYSAEIAYFADCVKQNRPIGKIRQEEIETVIDILNKL